MPSSVLPSQPAAASRRLPAIDWMRGMVMVLMALDHSSESFNRGRLFTDGVFVYHPGTPLPAAQFLTRWVTHLCAPTFVFLAGSSLALQVDRRFTSGESPSAIDRDLASRGVAIVAFEVWVSWFWMPRGMILLQVLYAIGTSFLCMVLLRRVSTALLACLAGALLLFGERVTALLGQGPPGATPLVASLLLVPGRRAGFIVAYPTLPWLAIMLLGWTCGRLLVRRPDPRDTSRIFALSGVALLTVFAVVRGVNAYGNMGLLREDESLVQWLHVSKYPPSLAFVALEIGVMFLCLAAFTLAGTRISPSEGGLLTVLGRTPMFFYLLHIPCLVLTARWLKVESRLGLGWTYFGAAAVIALLYPLCRRYGRYKVAHPGGWTRYV